MIDPVSLTQDLVRCPSVTPAGDAPFDVLEPLLATAGFECSRVDRGGVANLFARWGRKGANRTLGFNGHVDVVPVGDAGAWSVDPFGAEIKDGWLWGRGSTDMKSGVAAFAAAAIDFVKNTPPDGAVILAITGDEEGDATDGTVALLDWMAAENERMTHCLVGEPTCPEHMGQMMKIGRRGSLNAFIEVEGKQGHSAYLHKAVNPLPAMARLIDRLCSETLDEGTDHFDQTTVAPVTIDTGNPVTNVVPARARATVNIRFSDAHTGASLTKWIEHHKAAVAEEFGVRIELKVRVSGESFLTPPGELSELIADAAEAELGIRPVADTGGGTSDARFVKDHCPVVEYGLVARRMHQVDERASVDEIHQLKAIYGRILQAYFA